MGGSGEDSCGARVIHREKIDRAMGRALAPSEVSRVSRIFKAMGDPTRLGILKALEGEEMCVCDLAAFLGVSESAVSHQLRVLRNLELVANRREGTVLYYRLSDHHVSQLIALAVEHVRE